MSTWTTMVRVPPLSNFRLVADFLYKDVSSFAIITVMVYLQRGPWPTETWAGYLQLNAVFLLATTVAFPLLAKANH